jgi:hypothetical protein
MGERSSEETARDKHFGDRGGVPSKFKWSHSCQTSEK